MAKGYLTPRDIASLLPGSKRSGNGYLCKCPAHEDSKASLKVSPGKKATVMFCHAGCQMPEILAKLGLRREQLFHDYMQGRSDDGRAEVFQVLKKMQEDHDPPPIEDGMIRLDDIMWRALVNDKLPDEVWGEVMALAGVEYPWLLQMEYEEGMGYVVIFRDGPLFTFLRPLWEQLGRPSWHKLAGVAMDKMHATYVEAQP